MAVAAAVALLLCVILRRRRMKARVHASTRDRVQQNLSRVRGMKSREGSFDEEDGFSQELSPRNTSPEQLKGRVEALEGELALSVARGEGPADAKQAVLEQAELRARL